MSKSEKTNSRNGKTAENSRKRTNSRGKNNRSVDNRSSSNSINLDSKSTCNSPEWYAHNPQLMKDSASFPFSTPLGADTGIADDNHSASRYVSRLPGSMCLYYKPAIGSVGRSGDQGVILGEIYKTTPPTIRMAANNIYSFVRHANSGHANYFAPDLMLYILAADQAFAAVSWMTRAYGLMRYFEQRNTYMPKEIIKAMGFDYDSLKSNLADFRAFINTCIAQLSVVWIPNNLSYVMRHYWMNSFIYKDSESAKAQTYFYNPSCFWYYNPTQTEQGGGLDVHTLFTNTGTLYPNMTLAKLSDMMSKLITPLVEDEDMGIMAGDILKAYGAGNIWALNPIPEDYTVTPVYDKEVLHQIHNASFNYIPCGPVKQTVNGDLWEETSLVDVGFARSTHNRFFDFMGEVDPTPEMCMVASRLVPGSTTYVAKDTKYVPFISFCGTEIVQWVGIIITMSDGEVTISRWDSDTYSIESMNTYTYGYSMFTKFDWAPYLYLVTPTKDNYFNYDAILGDVDNYTVLRPKDFDKMHTTAVMSQFGIPTI